MHTSSPAASLHTLRTDTVGSFLRPPRVQESYRLLETGEIGPEELKAVQDEAIRQVIAAQEECGSSVVTDGEFRRLNFQDSFGAAVSGMASATNTASFVERRAAGDTPMGRWDPGYEGNGPAIVHRRPAHERLRLVRNLPLEEYSFAAGVATRPVKVTLIGPDRIAQRFEHESSREVYPDPGSFLDDVVAIEKQMVRELAGAGCGYVQIDEPGYTAYVDEPSLAAMRERGEDPATNMARSISANNKIVEAFPEVVFGVHLCRGNQRSMWHREGGYDAIAEELFGSLAHQRLLLEYDSARSGGFEPLRFVPAGKVVVLGLVSTKHPELEDRDELRRRIDEASRYISLDQLALSPQCGFASSLPGNRLSEDDQWRKLELIQEVADAVWG